MASKKTTKKSSTKLKLAAGVAAATLAAGSFIWLSFGNGPKIPVPAYTVKQVYDGDTFDTTENLRVRLAGIDAPEKDKCGGLESKKALEELILNKPVFIRVFYKDPRLISFVYTKDGLVNKKMLESGNAYYSSHSKDSNSIKTFADEAKLKKKGIFGPKCTQEINPSNRACNIKGNIAIHGKHQEDYYFTPDCTFYNSTKVQLYLGDEWFCSEKEAQEAGFRKPSQCP